MSTKGLSKKTEGIIVQNKLYRPLLEGLDEGVMLCEIQTGNILYVNETAEACLKTAGGGDAGALGDILEEEEIAMLLSGKCLSECFGERMVEMKPIVKDAYLWLTVTDCTEVVRMESASNRMLEMNRELRDFFNEYGDENIVIADSSGIIEFAGEDIARTCGVGTDYFVGKSVYEIEKRKIFYPSVTVKVLQTNDVQVVLQKTRHSKELVSVGAPFFDGDGNVEKVVSITKDFSKQLKVSSMLADCEAKVQEHTVDQFHDFVTCSEKMNQLKWMVKLVAPTNSTILINGETGTGKEVIARNIAALSSRKDRPFIKVNCGTISPTIVESELFGYEPGSFTGANREGKTGLIEAADGGILFLDEVSELPASQQVKLLHVLQEKMLIRVGGTKQIDLDIRVIAATNRSLEELVEQGSFREDLYYRLNVVPINIPPLRERRDDIPLLIKYFLERFNREHGKQARISKNAMDILHRYTWPGNVRELENTVERLVVTAPQNSIGEELLPEKIKMNLCSVKEGIQVNSIMKLGEAVEETERKLIEKVMKECGTTVKAAELLGVNQSTVSRKIARYGLEHYLRK